MAEVIDLGEHMAALRLRGERGIPHDLPELTNIIREATQTVEDELALEDQGWIRLGQTGEIITDYSRIDSLKLSRLYYVKDPLAKQAIRLWTDYTFGTGMTWSCEDKLAEKALSAYWNARENQVVLSSKGQRRSSTKLLVDGEIYFALFIGVKQIRIRLIDPLEITEIITDPDDKDDERYYKRVWTDAQAGVHTDYYPSHRNPKDVPAKDFAGKEVTATENGKHVLVYHLAWDNLYLRGMPLLLPAIDWIKQYRRFLASRVAIMLAMARFAWKNKVAGGAGAIAANKALLHEQEIPAGSVAIENLGSELTPIRADSNARNAYQDGRMLKLQVAAAVGIPEQYFGDISIGNLATAKTVELPMMKMFQSYQAIWRDTFQDIDELVLEQAKLPVDTHIDRDFPPIAPDDVFQAAQAIATIITAFPDFSALQDVQQVALLSIGINDPAEVLEELKKVEEGGDPSRVLAKALKQFRESIKVGSNGGKP